MSNFETEAKFTEQMRKLETTDPAHADLFNSLIGALLNNDTFLRSVTDQLLLQLQKHISDSQTALDAYYQQSAGYTDTKIAGLLGGAPTTLDTLGEIAQAMKDNESVVAALDAAVGKKANAAEFDSHVKDTAAHITGAERNNWNSKANGNHTHNYADAGHTHDNRYYTEAEINTKLNGKADSGHTHNYAASGHTHDDRYYTEAEINTKLNGKADSGHTHNYAASGHTHNYSDIPGRPNMYWEGDVFHLDF